MNHLRATASRTSKLPHQQQLLQLLLRLRRLLPKLAAAAAVAAAVATLRWKRWVGCFLVRHLLRKGAWQWVLLLSMGTTVCVCVLALRGDC
jgi:hypothetical protein